MTIIFGRLVNDFNNFGAGSAGASQLLSQVSGNALILVYLFIGKFALVYIHTSCFTITANRATSALRKDYIRALLRQDVSYFDTTTPGSVATSISTNADMVQTGLGEKVGVACQGIAMLVAAYIVALAQQWKLALVTATTMPAAVTGVGITVVLDAKLEAKILEIYSKAGGLVEEALSSIRIVSAFGAAEKLRRRYDAYLETAKGFGVKKGKSPSSSRRSGCVDMTQGRFWAYNTPRSFS
jgi:ATP-binding cassette, subfamily B (MDR/TAP), member 1